MLKEKENSMQELDIKVGYACNNNCIFCLNKDKRWYKEYPLEVLKRHIEISAAEGCGKLVISGGEPLISGYFFDLATFAKQKKIGVLEIQTNGRMLCYENFVKKIKKFEPIVFLVSLHFPNAKLYKKYCQTKGFYQVIEGIKNLIKYKCLFTVNTVVMRPNLFCLENIVRLLKKLNVRKIQYRFIDGKNVMGQYGAFVPRYSEATKIIQKIIKGNSDIEITLNEIPVCIMGEEFKNYLAPILNPERLNFSIADNRAFTTKEIIKQQFIHPNCKNCIYKSVCNGIRREYCQIYGSDEIRPVTK